jgi:hypothetical protein
MKFVGDGLYFGMDETLYHSLPWCGSTDIKMLYSCPEDYWASSHMNPLRDVEEESFALKFGTALHHRILYGEESFRKHYVALEGGNKDGTVEAEALKKWLVEQGASPRKLKADNERLAVEEFGVTLVAEKVFEKIIVSAQMIIKNPALVQAFNGGWPEVSIFWQQEVDDSGVKVPCKCRIDYLKFAANVDLKSFRTKERLMTIDAMVISDIKKYKYQIQADHYIEGRLAAKNLLVEGKVYCAPGTLMPTTDWLSKALANPKPACVLVFYKGDGAPVSKSYQMPFKGAWMTDGQSYRRRALVNYKTYIEKFGTEAWVNDSEPYTLEEEDFKYVD